MKRYTDYLNLNIINDTRDDNNLALEGLDLSTREGAADAAKLLNEVVVRISASQAKLGAIENRFTHNLDNLSMNILMAEQANGRIIDADYAIDLLVWPDLKFWIKQRQTCLLAQIRQNKIC